MPASYNVGRDYGLVGSNHGSSSPYWIVVVIPLGHPLSFSRTAMASVTTDVSQGAMSRQDSLPLVITDDCLSLSVSNSKNSHTKSMNASLKMTEMNYLTEILPGDWVFGWMVTNKASFDDLLRRLKQLGVADGLKVEPCNDFNDGLKFVGRVNSVRMHLVQDAESGIRHSSCNLDALGFGELDTDFFYDRSLESEELQDGSVGKWLNALGTELDKLWQSGGENNVNLIVKTLLNLLIGDGPAKDIDIGFLNAEGKRVGPAPQVTTNSPYAYLVPLLVGRLLGVPDGYRSNRVMSYADILELLQGVQKYPGDKKEEWGVFIPKLDEKESTGRRRQTSQKLLGTFMPLFASFVNKPLWSILEQYVNRTINELYTCMRVNPNGRVMPTVVFRQIPFTTEAFTPTVAMLKSAATPAEVAALQKDFLAGPDLSTLFDIGKEAPKTVADEEMNCLTTSSDEMEWQTRKAKKVKALSNLTDSGEIPHTKFVSEMPRWKVPASMIQSVDIGRSDATRCNFVHVFGQASYTEDNFSISRQLVENVPIRDDLDIMRSGMRSYMTTVECAWDDQVGKVPTLWMSLVADWMIGSHLTLNGSMTCFGIQAPICEGDNIEFDGVVYHIESVTHQAGMHGESKGFTTTLQLTNGMRADSSGSEVPIYPGFLLTDNTNYLPGLSLDQGNRTSGGMRGRSGK